MEHSSETILPIVPCGIICFGENGAIIWVNAFFSNLLGYKDDDLIGKQVADFLGTAAKIFYGTHFYPTVMLQGHADEIFLKFRSSTGKNVPVVLNAIKVASADGILVSCACMPVLNNATYEAALFDAKKKAEQELEQERTASGQKEKDEKQNELTNKQAVLLKQQNDELVRISSIVSHDLQEPLRKLDFYTNRLKKKKDGEKGDDKELSIIQKSAIQIRHRLLQLQTFLSIKRDVLLLDDVALAPIIEKQLAEVRILFPDILVKLTLNELPVVKGNPVQLSTLFHELIKNAFLYAAVGNILHIEIKGVILKVNIYQSLGNRFLYKDQVQITFSDLGKGFDAVHEEHVFEMLNKMNDGDTHLGMGLSICKRILEVHDGKIWADGNLGNGAKFYFTLPVGLIG